MNYTQNSKTTERLGNLLNELVKALPARSAIRVINSALKNLRPHERISPSEWAERYRKMHKGPRPGAWSNDYTPYLVDIMDNLVREEVKTIVAMLATQVGKTAMLACIIGYIIHISPASIYFAFPNSNLITDFVKDTLQDLFQSSDPFYKEGRVKPSAPGKSDTTLRKVMYVGGSLTFGSGESDSDMSGRSAMFALCDEVDNMPISERSGSSLDNLKNRIDAYRQMGGKVLLTSTPRGSAKQSQIFKEYKAGNQKEWNVGCPHCGERQYLAWSQVKWAKSKDEKGHHIHHPETAYYECSINQCKITDDDKYQLNLSGVWIAQAPEHGESVQSYKLSKIASPSVPFPDLVTQFLIAKEKPGGLLSFFNTSLCEPYDEVGVQPDWQKLQQRALGYSVGSPPRNVGFLTAGVDVQEKDGGRLEIGVWGWGPNRQRVAVFHHVIYSPYKDPSTWQQLLEFLDQEYVTEDGRTLKVLATCVDSSNGNAKDIVEDFCYQNRARRIIPIKGRGKDQISSNILYKASPVQHIRGVAIKGFDRLLPNVHELKRELYAALSIEHPQHSGYVYLSRHFVEEWFKQLTAEHIVHKNGRDVFEKKYSNNEVLDIACYARVAADYAGLARTNWRKLGVVVEEANDNAKIEYVEVEALTGLQYESAEFETGALLEMQSHLAKIYEQDGRVRIKDKPKPIEPKKQVVRPPRKSWYG